MGLVITARCDVDQKKFPILNYLPVVSLPDWLRRDGLDILIENEIKMQNGKLHSFLKAKNISSSIVMSIPLDEIANVHFSSQKGRSAEKKIANDFRSHIAEIRGFSNLIHGNPDEIYKWFCTCRSGDVQNIIKRLSRHSVPGHYFFETLDPSKSHSKGFVCLLREVCTLPKSVAERLGQGVSECEFLDLCGQSTNLSLSVTARAIFSEFWVGLKPSLRPCP